MVVVAVLLLLLLAVLVVLVVPVVPGDAWWCLWCLVMPGGAWWCLVVPGGAWWCLVVPGGAWWCLVVGSVSLLVGCYLMFIVCCLFALMCGICTSVKLLDTLFVPRLLPHNLCIALKKGSSFACLVEVVGEPNLALPPPLLSRKLPHNRFC